MLIFLLRGGIVRCKFLRVHHNRQSGTGPIVLPCNWLASHGMSSPRTMISGLLILHHSIQRDTYALTPSQDILIPSAPPARSIRKRGPYKTLSPEGYKTMDGALTICVNAIPAPVRSSSQYQTSSRTSPGPPPCLSASSYWRKYGE